MKNILVLNFFPAFIPPSSGGELRYFHLYKELSKYFDVTLLSPTHYLDEFEIIEHSSTYREYRVPKVESLHERLNWELLDEGFAKEVSALVSVYSGKVVNTYHEYYLKLYPDADIIVHEFPYMLYYDLFFGSDAKPRVYNSHNVEYNLQKQIYKGEKGKKYLKDVYDLEKRLVTNAGLVFATSEEEKAEFVSLYSVDANKIAIAPNGIEPNYFYMRNKQNIKKRTAFFIGSSHLPNIEAVEFIINDLAHKCPDVMFLIAGTCCAPFSQIQKPNVKILGKIDEREKEAFFNGVDIAINPMFSGAGTNLKILEFFSSTLPVISTYVGVRGLSVKNKKHFILANREDFAQKLMLLIEDEALKKRMGNYAKNYINATYSWKGIALNVRKNLNLLNITNNSMNVEKVLVKKYHQDMMQRVMPKRDKKLLIVTYRFTSPALGGAEVYLLELLKELEKFGKFSIDIAATNAFDIFNHYHFSTKITKDDTDFYAAVDNFNIYKFEAEELEDREKYENARLLMQVWLDEFKTTSQTFIDKYDKPILLGGWNFPEKLNEKFQIWSGKEASVFVKNLSKIKIIGLSPHRKKVDIYIDELLKESIEVEQEFNIELNLMRNSVVKLQTDENFIENDLRPLGILVQNIICFGEEKTFSLKLNYCYRDYLKEFYLDEYINALIQIAKNRDKKIDDLFQRTRGINSKGLESWLDKNIQKYDIVLGQSVPFAASVIAGKHAKKHHVPYAILPHFHFDDEYYHWYAYYKTMMKSNFTLAFPDISIEKFFDKLQIPTLALPGGGVEPKEFDDVNVSAFKNIYTSTLPFFLVLGRKTGAKNYVSVIEAIKKVNAERRVCNLVMIGKDEDGTVINEKNVFYLSEQPRNVVLGALKECRAVINMSESESFGIVAIESWMMKRPVIINENTPAFAELVTDGVNGLYANKNNLFVKIRKLLENEQFAARMGEKGFIKARSHFSWRVIAKKLQSKLLNECK